MAKRKVWDKESMKKAIEAVREKRMGYKTASKFICDTCLEG